MPKNGMKGEMDKSAGSLGQCLRVLSTYQVRKPNQFQAKRRKWANCTCLVGISNTCVITAGSLEWTGLTCEGFCLLVFTELLVSIVELNVLVSRKHISLRDPVVTTAARDLLYLLFSSL